MIPQWPVMDLKDGLSTGIPERARRPQARLGSPVALYRPLYRPEPI